MTVHLLIQLTLNIHQNQIKLNIFGYLKDSNKECIIKIDLYIQQ